MSNKGLLRTKNNISSGTGGRGLGGRGLGGRGFGGRGNAASRMGGALSLGVRMSQNILFVFKKMISKKKEYLYYLLYM